MFHPVVASPAHRRLSDVEAVKFSDLLDQLEALVDGAERLSPDLVSPFAARVQAARARVRELSKFAGELAEGMSLLEWQYRNNTIGGSSSSARAAGDKGDPDVGSRRTPSQARRARR